MSMTKKEAAAARAAAAQKADAADRLSALEVERRGYVQRGNDEGVAAVDDEIAHWSRLAGIPVESGATGDDDKTDETDGDSADETDDSGDAETDGGGDGADDAVDAETSADDAAATPKSRGRAKAAAAAKG